MKTDYEKYRGKCKEKAEALCTSNPDLILVKGWYNCPIWGLQQHWWCANSKNQIEDPTKDQFPSKGLGEYIPYKGVMPCEYCGQSISEEDIYFVDHHCYCSSQCYGHDIGF